MLNAFPAESLKESDTAFILRVNIGEVAIPSVTLHEEADSLFANTLPLVTGHDEDTDLIITS